MSTNNVTPIRPNMPVTTPAPTPAGIELHMVALLAARELQELLEQLAAHPEYGPGSCVEDAYKRMGDVIGMLEP